MATTGQVYPGSAESVSETGYANDTWVNPGNITADDTSYASVTAATFDSPDETYVLKAYNFDFSSIPDGSTINGVTMRMRAWYANGTGNIVLAQLLDTSRARVGTNQYSTFVNLTTSEADYTKGSSSDNWGNALTAAWVKDPDFGVGIAMGATGSNTDVFVDWVTLEIDYTPPDLTVTAANGVLTLTGNAASVSGPVTVAASVGGLTLVGNAASVVTAEPTFAQDGVTYLLRDKFTSAQNPLVDGNASEGAGVGYRDVTGTSFYAAGGRLRGGNNSSEGKIVYKPSSGGAGWERAGGRTFTALLTPDDAEGNLSIWLAETAGTLNGYGIRFDDKTVYITEPDGNEVAALVVDQRPGRKVQYLAGITLNEGVGAVYWISAAQTYTAGEWPLPAFPNARVLFVSQLGTFATVHPTVRSLSGFSYGQGVGVEDVRLFDIADWSGADGMALVADRFDRVDSSTTLGAGWTADAGTWGISTNQAYAATPTFNGRAYMDAGQADVWVVAEVTSGSDLGGWFGLLLRRSASGTFMRLYNNGSANIYLQKFLAGAYDDQVFSTYAAFATSQTKRWLAGCYGNQFRIFLNGDETVIQPTTDTGGNHTSGTGFGLFGGDAPSGQRWNNFAVYPMTLTLPAEFNSGAYPALVAAGTTVFSDTFTDTNGTAIATHNAAWAVQNGSFAIQSNALDGTPSPDHGYAYLDSGYTDVDVSVDITFPAATTEGAAGVAVRRADADNFIYARTLWQGGSNEIEIWSSQAGVMALLAKAYMGSSAYASSTTYRLALSAHGDLLDVLLDGELFATLILAAPLLDGTGVGVGESSGNTAGLLFDNFTVALAGTQLVTANAGGLTITGNPATVDAAANAQTVTAAAGALSLVGNSASVVPGAVTVPATTGGLALVGNAATVVSDSRVTANAGSASIVGNTAVITSDSRVAASNGVLTTAGNTASITSHSLVDATVGVLSLVGNTASPGTGSSPQTVNAAVGLLTLSGNAAGITSHSVVNASNGVMNVIGNQATITSASRVDAQVGVLTLSGNSATITSASHVDAAVGSMNMVGNQATIDLGSGSQTVNANPGTMTMTGNTALIHQAVPAQPGTLTIVGNTALIHVSVPTQVGAMSMVGNTASVTSYVRVAASAGIISLTGNAAAVAGGPVVVSASSGVMSMAGNNSDVYLGENPIVYVRINTLRRRME